MSKESKSNAINGGVGLLGLVFIVFLALKLADIGVVATWSWWWGPVCLVLSGLFIFIVIKVLFMAVIAPIVDWSNRRALLRRMSE